MIAASVTGRERLRFAYRSGDDTPSRRLAEPYRLVSTGRRWYLVAYDLDRDDSRTFRVDRIAEPFATGVRYTPRELPTGNAAEYLRQSMYGRQETYDFEVAFAAPAAFVAARLPKWFGAPEPIDERNCLLRSSARGFRGVAGGTARDGRLRVRSRDDRRNWWRAYESWAVA